MTLDELINKVIKEAQQEAINQALGEIRAHTVHELRDELVKLAKEVIKTDPEIRVKLKEKLLDSLERGLRAPSIW